MTARTDVMARPSWLPEGAELVGVADDLVSGQRYRLWTVTSAPRRRRLIGGPKQEVSFLVEDGSSGAAVARLRSFEEAVAWHDRTVISVGWQLVSEPVASPTERSAEQGPDDGEAAPIARMRLLRLAREARAGQSGS